MAVNISYYKNANDTKSTGTIALDLFLEGIKNGRWQDIVLPIRAISDKALRSEKKKLAPTVTIAGTFSERKDDKLEKHSGFISIDVDNIENINDVKALLRTDKYVYASFVSISGRGLCLLFKIKGTKHREAFAGISEYLYNKYNIIVDPTSVNVSRPRFVSYDPDLYINQFAELFEKYPEKKAPRKIDNVVFLDEDFKNILNQITANRINLCENYHEWLRIGFAISHQFNENGREYFHLVSQYSTKYDADKCDKQYDSMLKASGSNQVRINTFYYYAKQAGIEIYSPSSKKIIQAAKQGKSAGLSAATISNNLKKFEDITVLPETIEKISSSSNTPNDQLDEVSQMEMYLRSNYNLKKNVITMLIENNGEPLLEEDLNTMYLESVKVMPKAKDSIFNKLIQSNFITKYNPLLDFISQNLNITTTGNISKICSSIQTQDKTYAEYFLTKWLVSIIATIHGQHSPLMLIFQGPQNAGKTWFERNIFPEPLQNYIGEVSPGMKDVDFYLLMCQKLIIIDDECGGKSKKDDLHQKALLDKARFDVRKPYGKGNVTVQRLAMMCGNTNEKDILTDLTGNRRYLIIDFQSYDWEIFNSVDKTDLLMECYHLYKSGYNFRLTKDDIEYLNKYDHKYTTPSSARELIQKYFSPTTEQKGTPLTATDIVVYIESETKLRLTSVAVGRELTSLGYNQNRDEKGRRVYYCVPLSQNAAQMLAGIEPTYFPKLSDELPF
jgi:predicted P-loop ATPase